MTRPVPAPAGLAARVILGAILVYAGATKAAGPVEEFAIVVGSYDMLPRDMVLTAATFLPWLEIFLGWTLIFGLYRRAAAAAAGGLFACFLLALGMVQLKGIQLPNCGCFGDEIHFTPIQAFAFDSFLAFCCWLAWSAEPTALSLDSWTEGGYTSRHVQR